MKDTVDRDVAISIILNVNVYPEHSGSTSYPFRESTHQQDHAVDALIVRPDGINKRTQSTHSEHHTQTSRPPLRVRLCRFVVRSPFELRKFSLSTSIRFPFFSIELFGRHAKNDRTISILISSDGMKSSQPPTGRPIIRSQAFLTTITPQLEVSFCCGVGCRD
jgi:hypothetical protein